MKSMVGDVTSAGWIGRNVLMTRCVCVWGGALIKGAHLWKHDTHVIWGLGVERGIHGIWSESLV